MGHSCELGLLRATIRELKSVIRKGESSLRVLTYSSYFIFCLDKWSPVWSREAADGGDWRNSRGRWPSNMTGYFGEMRSEFCSKMLTKISSAEN